MSNRQISATQTRQCSVVIPRTGNRCTRTTSNSNRDCGIHPHTRNQAPVAAVSVPDDPVLPAVTIKRKEVLRACERMTSNTKYVASAFSRHTMRNSEVRALKHIASGEYPAPAASLMAIAEELRKHDQDVHRMAYLTSELTGNPDAPPEALGVVNSLMNNTGEHARLLMANHANTSEMDLYSLALHINDDIRQAAAMNDNTPLNALEILKDDSCPAVARAAYISLHGVEPPPETNMKPIQQQTAKPIPATSTSQHAGSVSRRTRQGSNLLRGKNVVFTGKCDMSRTELERVLSNAGGKSQSSVTRSTDFLVVGRQKPSVVGSSGKSTKERKVESLNRDDPYAIIEVIGYQEFLEMAVS